MRAHSSVAVKNVLILVPPSQSVNCAATAGMLHARTHANAKTLGALQGKSWRIDPPATFVIAARTELPDLGRPPPNVTKPTASGIFSRCQGAIPVSKLGFRRKAIATSLLYGRLPG